MSALTLTLTGFGLIGVILLVYWHKPSPLLKKANVKLVGVGHDDVKELEKSALLRGIEFSLGLLIILGLLIGMTVAGWFPKLELNFSMGNSSSSSPAVQSHSTTLATTGVGTRAISKSSELTGLELVALVIVMLGGWGLLAAAWVIVTSLAIGQPNDRFLEQEAAEKALTDSTIKAIRLKQRQQNARQEQRYERIRQHLENYSQQPLAPAPAPAEPPTVQEVEVKQHYPAPNLDKVA